MWPRAVSACPRDGIDVAQDCIDVTQGLLMCPRDCIDVAQEMNKWGAAVNVVMNLLVPLLASQGPRCL
jgi:hypothetical protein